MFNENDAVMISGKSSITAKKWSNTGTVNIDMSNLTRDDLPYTFLTVTDSTKPELGTINLTNCGDSDYAVVCKKDGDVWKAQVVPAEASVTDSDGVTTNYETLTEAVEAANDGDIIELLANISITSTVKIEKSLSIDGKNHKITATKSGSDYYAIMLDDNNVKKQLNVSIGNLTLNTTGYQVAFFANGDYNSTASLNNVDITCDGECVYSNGRAAVTVTNCDFLHEGIYAEGKDPVYYSALIVGYGAELNVKDSTVHSFANGACTFPSGGTVTLENTDITISSVANSENAGYALWSRNEDYTNHPEYCKDSIIEVKSGRISGGFKITDKYTSGDNNKYDAIITLTGGSYSVDPTDYVASGYGVASKMESGKKQYYVLAAPEQPTVTAVDSSSITVVAKQGEKYRIGDNGTWQTSGSFTGLDANTAYTIQSCLTAHESYETFPTTSTTVKTTNVNTEVVVESGATQGSAEVKPENGIVSNDAPVEGKLTQSQAEQIADNTTASGLETSVPATVTDLATNTNTRVIVVPSIKVETTGYEVATTTDTVTKTLTLDIEAQRLYSQVAFDML